MWSCLRLVYSFSFSCMCCWCCPWPWEEKRLAFFLNPSAARFLLLCFGHQEAATTSALSVRNLYFILQALFSSPLEQELKSIKGTSVSNEVGAVPAD